MLDFNKPIQVKTSDDVWEDATYIGHDTHKVCVSQPLKGMFFYAIHSEVRNKEVSLEDMVEGLIDEVTSYYGSIARGPLNKLVDKLTAKNLCK